MGVELRTGVILATDEAKQKFLDLYIENPVINHVVKTIGMERRTFYHWLKNDEAFAKEFKVRQNIIVTFLEDEAYRRAVTGTLKPVYQGGEQVGEIREYSDSLLALLLKANAPAKYKDAKGDVTINLPKPEIIHVHSQVPLAQSEQDIQMLEFEDIPKVNEADSSEDLLNDLQ